MPSEGNLLRIWEQNINPFIVHKKKTLKAAKVKEVNMLESSVFVLLMALRISLHAPKNRQERRV